MEQITEIEEDGFAPLNETLSRREADADSEAPVEESPVWLTIYSDLMTNLMLFFLMLYGITRMSVDAKTTILDSIASHFDSAVKREALRETFEKTAADIKDSAVDALGNPVVSRVIIEPSGYRIILKAPVMFDSASDTIKKASMKDLRELGSFIRTIPNAIEIAGHTDSTPVEGTRWRSNWELSLARAESVRRFLTASSISAERFCISGYGSTRPLYPNDSAENRLRNRRIEIIVMDAGK